MNPKNTLLLVVLAAGLFSFIFFYEQHRPPPLPPAKMLPGLDIAAVTNIQILQGGQNDSISAERTTNGTWQLLSPINYPAQSMAVENLLRELQELTPQDRISAEDLKNRRNFDADYGMDKPTVTIVINNDERTLKLGNFTAPGDQIYAEVVGSGGVDIVSKDILQYIPHQSVDWRDTLFLNLPGRGVFDHVTVTNGTRTFTIKSDRTNSSWHILPHDRVNLYKLAGLFNRLQTMRVERFVSDKTNADLEPFGLQPPQLELDFDRDTNHLLTLQIGKSPTNDPGMVYARRDDQSTVVLVSSAAVEGWAEKNELRDRTLAGMYTWLPDEIAVTGRANFTVRRVTNDAWRVTAPYNFPADTNLTKQFLLKIARLSVFPTNGPIAEKDIVPPSEWTNYGLATPVWKYVLRSNVTNGTTVITNAVMAELDFGAITNTNTIFARRPEEPSVYAVALADFQQLPASGIQLHERRIWDFTEDQVSRIVIRQDGVPTELLHRSQNDWTLAPGSQGVINPLAVEVAAAELGLLAADEFVERGAEKKADYGFTDKSLQISAMAGKAGETKTYSVDFGGWSPRGLRYGLVELDGQKWIFEFPAVVYDRLMSYFNLHEEPPPGGTSGKSASNVPAK